MAAMTMAALASLYREKANLVCKKLLNYYSIFQLPKADTGHIINAKIGAEIN
jgi:hypothetical protein